MTSATAQSIIKAGLEHLGVYAPSEIMSDADAERGLWILNGMMDSWSNESLATYAELEQSALLVPGQQSYTIGPGGDFNMTRPLRVILGPGSAYTQDENGNNYGMDVVPRDKWNLLGNRSGLITSNFPDTLFYDPQYPLGVINVFPTPNIAYTMFWDSYLQLAEFPDLTTPIILPPGYQDAIQFNFEVRAKNYWVNAQMPPDVLALALETKGIIKRTNMRENVANYDPEIVSRAGISYNPYSDRVGSSTT
jgi:hypothetical protein